MSRVTDTTSSTHVTYTHGVGGCKDVDKRRCATVVDAVDTATETRY